MPITVAVDANGADLGPAEVAAGAADAAQQGVRVVLFGPAEEFGEVAEGIEVVDAPVSIAKAPDPVRASRAHPDASIVLATRAVADGDADAFVSGGSTGPALAAGLFNIRRAAGIHRPALAIPVPRWMLTRPAASAVPVEPPLTKASASPSATARVARTIEASGVARLARTGSGALAIETGASTTSIPSATSPKASAGPNSTTRTPCEAAIAAPAATSAGPRSAPLGSTATVTDMRRGYSAARPRPRLVVVVVIVVVHVDDLAARVRPARRAHAMRQPRAVARRARVVGRRRDLVLGATLGGARVRLLLLGDGHERQRRVADRRCAGPGGLLD